MASHKPRYPTLVEHIYGPYPDHIFLQDKLKPKPGQDEFIDLHCVTMYAGRRPTGLDETEFIVNPPKGSVSYEDKDAEGYPAVSFCGVLEIRDLSWLTERGRICLDRDIRARDKLLFPQAKDRQEFSLELVLNNATRGQPARFKVHLMCERNMLAHYLTSKLQLRTHQLLLYSGSKDGKKPHRKFAIQSLHAETYEMSRTFMARYRLRALLVELKDIDAGATPPHLKDHHWFVDMYCKHIIPRDLEAERNRKLRPTKPHPFSNESRFPRHIPRSQIYSELAEHADWILANQIGMAANSTQVGKKEVFIPLWVKWCDEAWAISVEAKKNGAKWGMSELVDLKKVKREGVGKRLAKFGATPEYWEKHLKSWMDSSVRYVEGGKFVPRPPPAPRAERVVQPFKSGGFVYDSDFSPAYTSPEWDESDVDNPDVYDPPRSVRVLLQPKDDITFCQRPPKLARGSYEWYCPGQECTKVIDLLHPSEEDLEILSEDLARQLLKKSWKIKDAPIQKAFLTMVSHHYEQVHVIPAGMIGKESEHGLRYKLPEHLKRPKPHKKSHAIKEEED